ncbi:hypothetical protein L9F63_028055, partial [Diploptera punctata]
HEQYKVCIRFRVTFSPTCRVHFLRILSVFSKTESSVYNYIHRSKFNFFSTTFFRPSGDTPAIFRLPRCLYSMKCCVIYRINNFLFTYNISNFLSTRNPCYHVAYDEPMDLSYNFFKQY